MPLMDYVIGGMDRSFKLKLYHALRVLDDAGLAPGMTSGFRDDYRQSIASGLKASTDRSYHGGSFRGGYGHGLAADIVSVKGETRTQRLISSESLWKWIDAHGQEFGIGRPYLDKDPAHVAPIDGKEYVAHRGGVMRDTPDRKRRSAATITAWRNAQEPKDRRRRESSNSDQERIPRQRRASLQRGHPFQRIRQVHLAVVDQDGVGARKGPEGTPTAPREASRSLCLEMDTLRRPRPFLQRGRSRHPARDRGPQRTTGSAR
jgi:hypothetical protein